MKQSSSIRWLVLGAAVLFPLKADVRDWIAEWKAFRAAYPYHIQVVALSGPDNVGKRLLILSEPPPGITVQDIEGIDPALGGVRVAQHTIGYDGWVRDALVELPPMPEPRLAGLVDRVHAKLFGTAYKAVAIGIPRSPQLSNAGLDLDLHVSSGSLTKWLVPDRESSSRGWFWPAALVLLGLWGLRAFGKNRSRRHVLALATSVVGLYMVVTSRGNPGSPREQVRFTPAMGGEARTCSRILRDNDTGVYLSTPPGLVIWIVDRDRSLDHSRREVRQFALDSDILLGAVGHGRRVAILARERVAPVAVLPPLRTETILQLASVREAELAQSYERTHFFAGKYDGRDDWAPIYLSDILIDTEYGSLLNITDQILKSWSMSGQVRYINFGYPDPPVFPFPQPLIRYAHATEVTFNWNTKGAGYSSNAGGYDVFAWTRTGALPVDYLGSSSARLHQAEDVGYEYFARRKDPNLVRVVQYAELYQIFQHFKIQSYWPAPAYRQGVPEEFREQLAKVLYRFRGVDDGLIRARLSADVAQGMIECKHGVAGIMDSFGAEGIDELARAIAAPRLYSRALLEKGISRSDRNSREMRILSVAYACQQYGYLLRSLSQMTPDQSRAAFVKACDRDTKGWIRTASIVVSRPMGEFARMTGGHSLASKVTSFRVSPGLKAGELRVVEENGQRVLLYSEQDSTRIQETVRTIGRDEGASRTELEREARAALARSHADERPLAQVLSFVDGRKPSATRGFAREHVPAYSDHTGWWARDGSITDAQMRLVGALSSDEVHAIIVERNAAGTYTLYDGPSKRILQAGTQPGAADAVLAYIGPRQGKTPVRLYLRGFEPREAKGFVKSTELQLAGFDEPPRLSATVEDSEIEPRQLKALLQEKYNFREARIRSVSEPFVTEEGLTGVHVDAEIPALRAGKPPLLVRIKVILRQGVEMTAQLMAAIRQRIISAFMSGEIRVDEDTLLKTGVFVKTLERISPDVSYVEVKVVKEGKDLHIVRNRDDRARSEAA